MELDTEGVGRVAGTERFQSFVVGSSHCPVRRMVSSIVMLTSNVVNRAVQLASQSCPMDSKEAQARPAVNMLHGNGEHG